MDWGSATTLGDVVLNNDLTTYWTPYAGSLKFLKGEPVDVPPKGHPAVLELWATWCDRPQAKLLYASTATDDFTSMQLTMST